MRIGVDIVSVNRIAGLGAAYPATDGRFFAAEELQRAGGLEGQRRAEFLAGRFAVKEAFVKAVGSLEGIEPRDIVCVSEPSGQPRLSLGATAQAAMEAANCRQASVTISHDAGLAVAVVLLY